MSNFECTVTIADIYGAEWWSRNKAELDREWEWGFALAGAVKVAHVAVPDIQEFSWYMTDGRTAPRIILHRRKPKPPTLREVYGVDEVTIPAGWEWTGAWRVTTSAEANADLYAKVPMSRFDKGTDFPYHRLILRERPKKVWFKAEAEKRPAMWQEWVWDDRVNEWAQMTWGSTKSYLCATRHEEVDQTVQVVTQAMVDGVVNHA